MRFSDLWRGLALWAGALCASGAHALPEDATAPSARAVPALSDASLVLARQVLSGADHGGRPFAIVDKRSALLAVYFADGRLAGTSPVLLGRTPGDRSVPGVGERAQNGQLRPGDHTTPAGRFETEPGHNLAGEHVVWVDYANALAIHRLRPGPAQERRAQRLASADARERRASAGCVVVPVAFYEAVIQPVLGRGPGVVYVLAEDSPALPSDLPPMHAELSP